MSTAVTVAGISHLKKTPHPRCSPLHHHSCQCQFWRQNLAPTWQSGRELRCIPLKILQAALPPVSAASPIFFVFDASYAQYAQRLVLPAGGALGFVPPYGVQPAAGSLHGQKLAVIITIIVNNMSMATIRIINICMLTNEVP